MGDYFTGEAGKAVHQYTYQPEHFSITKKRYNISNNIITHGNRTIRHCDNIITHGSSVIRHCDNNIRHGSLAIRDGRHTGLSLMVRWQKGQVWGSGLGVMGVCCILLLPPAGKETKFEKRV